jgi:queuine tRNA-ribosyltransferase/7-cyano-7-deazaguanine tRNA-ribosyltransferase
MPLQFEDLTPAHLRRPGGPRRGRILTDRGAIETPEFLPVGTRATVKAVTPRQLMELGAQCVLANTYHLYLRPGADLIRQLGGLHSFMSWHRPIMTDSGGFQAFSLGVAKEHGVGKMGGVFPGEGGQEVKRHKSGSSLARVDEEGVTFRSYVDGSTHRFTPESSMEIQRRLGADLILAFDECTSPLAGKRYTELSLERTHRWAVRCLEAPRDPHQSLYGILQGGAYQDLRQRAVDFMAGLPFDAFAVGGSLGETKQDMLRVLEWTVPQLPAHAPRHLLGIGEMEDLFEGVERGIDTFDCVIPTRFARTANLMVSPDVPHRSSRGTINLRQARYRDDARPIEEDCPCYTCANYSRAYLRYLFSCQEILAGSLCSIHNLSALLGLTRRMREALEEGTFAELKAGWLSRTPLT